MARFSKLSSTLLSTSALVSVMAAMVMGCASGDSDTDSDIVRAGSENAAAASSALGTGNEKYVGETGQVTLTSTVDGGVVATVTLRNSYINPVVVAFINTRNGDESVEVRVRSVTKTSFEIFMQEPDNQTHNAETVSYIVVERGRHVLDGGLVVEAGSVDTATVHSGTEGYAGDAVGFAAAFGATPAVLHSLNTHNNNDFMASMVTNVGTSGFEIGLERAETGKTAVSEKVAWIAMSTGSGTTNGSPFAVGQSNDGSNDGVTNSAHSIALSGFSAAPDIVVSVYGENGTDGSWARGSGSYSSSIQGVYAEEDQIQDSERSHADETFAYAAFEPDTDLVLAGRSTKWRLRNAAVPSSGQWAFRELMLCADAACSSPLSGTAIDSGYAMSWAPAENAFDGDTNTMWKTTDAGTEGASWIGLELSDAADVQGVYLKTDNIVYHSEDIYVEYYDSDSGLWVTTDVLTDLAAASELTLSVGGTRPYFYVDTSMTADEAEAYCESLGTTLATVSRADDNMTVAELCDNGGGILCWIGLNDEATEGSPEWRDMASVPYTSWNTRGSGDNQGTGRDCAVISGVDQSWIEYGSWEYNQCSSPDRSAICNGPEMVREYVLVDEQKTREDAQAHCESLGDGYTLATITSQEENDIVADLCDTSGSVLCFIGLSDAVTEGSPIWDDGAPLVYEKWNTLGSGDNQGTGRDCPVISGVDQSWIEYGSWEYNQCTGIERSFICSHPVRK